VCVCVCVCVCAVFPRKVVEIPVVYAHTQGAVLLAYKYRGILADECSPYPVNLAIIPEPFGVLLVTYGTFAR
jgi:hypothetical protein